MIPPIWKRPSSPRPVRPHIPLIHYDILQDGRPQPSGTSFLIVHLHVSLSPLSTEDSLISLVLSRPTPGGPDKMRHAVGVVFSSAVYTRLRYRWRATDIWPLACQKRAASVPKSGSVNGYLAKYRSSTASSRRSRLYSTIAARVALLALAGRLVAPPSLPKDKTNLRFLHGINDFLLPRSPRHPRSTAWPADHIHHVDCISPCHPDLLLVASPATEP